MDKLVKILIVALFGGVVAYLPSLFEWLAMVIGVSDIVLAVVASLLMIIPIITLFVKKWSDRGKIIDSLTHNIDEFIRSVKMVKHNNKTTSEIIQNTQKLLQKVENVVDSNSQMFMKESELGERKSPIVLNKKGKEIAKAINITEVLKNLGDAIHKKIADEQPQTEYDWQEKIFNFAQFDSDEFLTEDNIKLFKKIAFEEGLVMKDIKFVLGITLRDFIFDKENLSYKNIKD